MKVTTSLGKILDLTCLLRVHYAHEYMCMYSVLPKSRVTTNREVGGGGWSLTSDHVLAPPHFHIKLRKNSILGHCSLMHGENTDASEAGDYMRTKTLIGQSGLLGCIRYFPSLLVS